MVTIRNRFISINTIAPIRMPGTFAVNLTGQASTAETNSAVGRRPLHPCCTSSPKRDVVVRNQFGEEVLQVLEAEYLLAPAIKNDDKAEEPPHTDHYKCYQVKRNCETNTNNADTETQIQSPERK